VSKRRKLRLSYIGFATSR
jgi:hypothetical protein